MIISTQNPPSLASVIRYLVDHGYHRVDMVLGVNEFAVRGEVLDIATPNHREPIRIGYDGEKIDRIAAFNIHSQRSYSSIDSIQLSPPDTQLNRYDIMPLETPADGLISDIKVGDYVVHEDHGIGVFTGLVRRSIGGRDGEYVVVQYKGEDRLYVPIDGLHRLHRYGEGKPPAIHGMSDGRWAKTKAKVRREMTMISNRIFALQKKRNQLTGFACGPDSDMQLAIESAFPFALTSDQSNAINAVKQDMESTRPMDRLLCGDVGYGKTEVIVRAIAKIIDNGKQAAVLCPTTLLANQHAATLSHRFSAYPIRVLELSRLNPVTKQEISAIGSHQVDVVCGTHRLLSNDVKFADLGLIVIDEEQRFGVRYKEKLKNNHPLIDVLTVTATPIPRTLYHGLTGIKSISMIKTPPQKRHPIITEIHHFSIDVIRSAIQFEQDRDGQVFFVTSKIADIPNRIAMIQEVAPSASVGFAHGELSESQLLRTMTTFRERQLTVLVSTSIIENGLDLPSANTIIVDDATQFGLAQLHQIRGRVGRSDKQAYAYLLVPDHMTETAKNRIRAIQEFAALGSGYQLALRDLEIRGAGTLLGEYQHGHMTAVGFELYCKFLENAMFPSRHSERHVLPDAIATYIPETYIENPSERFAIYRRLSRLTTDESLTALLSDLADRYGQIPPLVKSLCQAMIASHYSKH